MLAALRTAASRASPAVRSFTTTSPAKLPPLPYPYNALAPVISEQIMTIHHSKHHQAYVTNLNLALEKAEKASKEGDVNTLVAVLPAVSALAGVDGKIRTAITMQFLFALFDFSSLVI